MVASAQAYSCEKSSESDKVCTQRLRVEKRKEPRQSIFVAGAILSFAIALHTRIPSGCAKANTSVAVSRPEINTRGMQRITGGWCLAGANVLLRIVVDRFAKEAHPFWRRIVSKGVNT